jgi:hypothetical protein
MSSFTHWKQILTAPEKRVFSGYVHLKGADQEADFCYQNMNAVPEEVAAVILRPNGEPVAEQTAVLEQSHALRVSARKLLESVGISDFQGSILLVSRPMAARADGAPYEEMDFYSSWRSRVPGSAAQIIVGAIRHFNEIGRKEKQSFFMGCPAVVTNNDRKTIIAIINHSSDPNYADTPEIVPELRNAHGRMVKAAPMHAPPFGIFLIDVDDVFGEEGRKLLAETGGYGSVGVWHRGHIFSTLFFHVDRRTGAILSGTHTQPLINVLSSYGVTHPVWYALAPRIPGLYAIWKVWDALRPEVPKLEHK